MTWDEIVVEIKKIDGYADKTGRSIIDMAIMTLLNVMVEQGGGPGGASAVDVTDRAARILGEIDLDEIKVKTSTDNSTSTPLEIDEVFTGEAELTTGNASMLISLTTDVASAIDGFSLQWSNDEINWDFLDVHTIEAGDTCTLIAPQRGKYFRVVYTNGGTEQAYFRLQVLFYPVAVALVEECIGSNVTDHHMGIITKSVLAAKKPNEEYVNIHATTGGNLKISVEEFNGATQGQAAMDDSLPVVIASDQSNINVDIVSAAKGNVFTAHDGIIATATSVEIDCRGHNGAVLHLEGSLEASQTWEIEILGSAISGGTFGKGYYQSFEQKIGITDTDLAADGVVNFTSPGVNNYIKIRATLSGGTAELTVKVTPVNL